MTRRLARKIEHVRVHLKSWISLAQK